MARTKKTTEVVEEEDINLEDLDLMEFGVRPEEYLNIRDINQKSNLKRLKKRLRNITESMNVTEETLGQLIIVLENCNTSGKISIYNKERILNLITNFDDSLIDIVWNIDNIIEDADYGNLFQQDCELAEQKIIEIVEVTKDIEDLFNKLKALESFEESFSAISESIMEILEIIYQMQFLFKQIQNIHENL